MSVDCCTRSSSSVVVVSALANRGIHTRVANNGHAAEVLSGHPTNLSALAVSGAAASGEMP